jgi:hypothetical protein
MNANDIERGLIMLSAALVLACAGCGTISGKEPASSGGIADSAAKASAVQPPGRASSAP